MQKFIPGLKLSRLFYEREVKRILAGKFPSVRYSAALIGWGSEVLGFDTSLSRDHHWGPRVLLFLSNADYPKFSKQMAEALSHRLPHAFMGYSTNFSEPEPNGVRHLVELESGPVNHMIQFFTVRSFVKTRLGFDIGKPILIEDWLTFPQQRLLELSSGEVYHDGLRELQQVRRKLHYYPKDVWLYLLAAQWKRISQEEAFVGRTGDVGDEMGSRIVATRIVREMMRLSFLMERRYIPYSKWIGSGFARLRVAKQLGPLLNDVLNANDWKTREQFLSKAYSIVARRHNTLRITDRMPTIVTSYFDRPYMVIHTDRFSDAIKKVIRDPAVKRLKPDLGSIDQFTDSTEVVEDTSTQVRLKDLYQTN
jgi:hypothetical protein